MSFQNLAGSLLFGAANKTGNIVSGPLKELGIDMLRMSTSDVQLFVQPEYNQYRYGLYKANLPAFMEALDGKEQQLAKPFHPLEDDDRCVAGFHVPDVILNFDTRMSDDVRDKILNEMPGTAIREVIRQGGRVAYIISGVRVEHIPVFPELPSVNFITPTFDNTINIDCLPYYKAALKIAFKFASLHRYPAFMDSDHMKSFERRLDSFHVIEEESMVTEGDQTPVVLADRLGGLAPVLTTEIREALKSWATKTGRGGGMVPPQDAQDPEFHDENTIGLPGFYAPFIPALAIWDVKTVPRVIQRFFMGCLGFDAEDSVENMERFYGRFGIIGKTDEGIKLAHLYKCLEAALDGQFALKFRVSPVTGYLGCALLGHGTAVAIGEREIVEASTTDLRRLIVRSDAHRLALEQIATIMQLGEEDKERLMKIATITQFRQAILTTPLTETQKTSIQRSALRLNFNIPFWKVNSESFAKLFQLLNVSGPIPDDLPIHPSKVFSEDHLELGLACFGLFAPTFKVPGGREVDLSQPLTVVIRGANSTSTTTRNITRVGCRSIPLDQAITDWRWVKENKKIWNPFMQPKQKTSLEHFTRFFEGANYEMIITEIKKYSNVLAPQAGGSHGGKRTERDGDGAAGAGKKRRVINF